MNPDDKIALLNYLGTEQPFNFMDSKRYSTLVAGLRDCRANTKRDLRTGMYDPKIPHGDVGNWLAAIGYFTILDQMGSCYKLLGDPEPPASTNSIKFAIEQFAFDKIDNSDRQLNALIALRNAFTHDFNLLNVPYREKYVALQQHKFTVTVDTDNDWIVKLPDNLWNGDIDQKDFLNISDSTFVNLFGLGNLVEEIYNRIVDKIKNDSIDLRLSNIRLVNKYTFITSHHPIK